MGDETILFENCGTLRSEIVDPVRAGLGVYDTRIRC
jgi:hypothetical protein